MALITRCPACSTMFKVVPDQLRISDGWVRCGHCAEVFDAHQHMQALPPPAVAVPPVSHAPQAPAFAPGTPRLPPFTPAALRLSDPSRAAVPSGRPPPVPGAGGGAPALAPPAPPTPRAYEPGHHSPGLRPQAPAAGAIPDLDSMFAPVGPADARETHGPADPAQPTAPQPWSGIAPEPEPERAPQAQPPGVAAALHPAPPGASPAAADVAAAVAPPASQPGSAPQPEPAPDPVSDVSFVRQARRRAFWRRPGVRAVLSLLALALAALLVGQFALHERDRIAAIRPELAPWLNRLCEPLGCSVQPLRHIEALVIDASSFGRLRGDSYRLALSLRNLSPLEVAMPALELTVTDAQDQPLLRRVLLPDELGARSPTLAGASEWSTQIGVAVNAGGARVAGYRLMIFYP